MKNYWISWWQDGTVPFTLHSPWWVSGFRCYIGDIQQASICAAVKANSAEEAQNLIHCVHDNPLVKLEFRFCEERAEYWIPFSERFPKEDWMRWPDA